MSSLTPDGRQIIPEDFWVVHSHSATAVLAESYHLLLLSLQFVNFFSQALLNPNLSPDEIQENAKTLARYIESVNSIMKAVEYYINTEVKPST